MTEVVAEPDVVDDAQPSRSRRSVPIVPAIVLALACVFLGGALMSWWNDRGESPSDVDVGFYDDMTTHHLQALQLAHIYQRNGENADLQSRADEIDFFQSGDVREMQNAMTEWGETGSPDIAMEWMGMPVAPSEMPGMQSDERIEELNRLTGAELDDLWTQTMIDHHAGGIHMAEYAAENASIADVREFAAAVVRNQQREIDELNQVRVDLGLPIHEPQF